VSWTSYVSSVAERLLSCSRKFDLFGFASLLWCPTHSIAFHFFFTPMHYLFSLSASSSPAYYSVAERAAAISQ